MNEVGVGVCLLVVRNKKLLVAERIGSTGKGYLGCPGGHQEKFERWEITAIRETTEEAGPDLKVIIRPKSWPYLQSESNIPLFVTNNVLVNGLHYVTVWLRAEWQAGEAKNMEPSKKIDWIWMTLEELIEDPRMSSGRNAWTGGGFHDALHWMPIPELFKYRDRIGL